MGYNFKECNREQLFLLPASMREWLPEGHLAWFILDAVEEMDLAAFYRNYREDGWGRAAYEPRMMVALLVYAYSLGVRSSREIERACEDRVSFRVITANQRPDHTTIARFRQEFTEEIGKLFTEVLHLCVRAGLVKVGVVVLDGTKVAGNASLSANRTYEHLEREVAWMLEEAEAKDAEEDAVYGTDREGSELPEELRKRDSRLARLRRAKAELEREAEEAAVARQREIEAREREQEVTGKPRRGRKPKAPDPTPRREAKANLTDPESRIMKTRTGYVQGYNAQVMVTKDQVIVAAEVTQDQNDVHQLHPMLGKVAEELATAGVRGRVAAVVADAGYQSEEGVRKADPNGPELFLATTNDRQQRVAMEGAPAPRGRIPKGLGVKERMERKLLTQRGRALYKLRGQTVEPVFGQIKGVRDCDGFMRRGLTAAKSEWRLICATHNLLKLWRSGKALLGAWLRGTRLRREPCWAY
ncbi:MAG: transposase [Candidatus Bipolaricaulota bacterium]